MTAGVKICGLTTPETVQAAIDGGASFIGFMFFDRSPRNITPEAAARLSPPIRAAHVSIVVVTVDPDDVLLDRLTATLKPDLIQLHGKETPSRAREIAVRTGAGIIKAVPVSSASDIDAARRYETVVEHLMFEGKPPQDSDRPGGVGAKFDWTILSGRRFERPWFLAGGLDPWNVSEALQQSGAPLVDVSSGVERGPGIKDPLLISAFLEAVRRA